MADRAGSEPLFYENGASWYWVMAGPVSALAMLTVQLTSGAGVQWLVPTAFLVLVSGFIAVQIKAARIHTSVELTETSLRQGTQTIGVDEIVALYPAPKNGMRSYYDDRRLYRNAAKSAKPNALANRAAQPEPKASDADEVDEAVDAATVRKWQSARALGELTGVPRGRTGIGLKLSGGRTAQAWARRHVELRTALTELIARRG